MATQHRGEILQDIVRKTGVNQAQLARALGISRSSLYRHYGVPNLSLVFLRRAGAAIGYDFSAHIRGMVPEASAAAEPAATYAPDTLAECQAKLLRVHEQFMEKVQQYDELKLRYEALLTERGAGSGPT